MIKDSIIDDQEEDTDLPKQKKFWLLAVFACIFCIAISICFNHMLFESLNFPEDGKILLIENGMSVEQIANKTKNEGIVRSSFVLYALLTFIYDPTNIYAGNYRFEKPLSVFEVASKLASNDIDSELLKVTVPEGVTRKQIAQIASAKIQNFDTNAFLELTRNNEGYLFPDTYFISPDFTAEKLVTLLTETFGLKIAKYREQMLQSKFTEYEILILASILEREANSLESMKMVSGILQNRLDIGMALQTDASIEYVLDKELSELTPEDLKIDTPYNTYLYPGLPPTPIGNAGLQAIDAVLNPTVTDYFYYITDSDGEFHYAKTFEEHKRNIAKHLR